FFQAEDGIRDGHVTGVQTCALPIFDDIMKRMETSNQLELKVVLKADVQGSVQAVREAMTQLSTQEVKVNIVLASVGGIKESDIRSEERRVGKEDRSRGGRGQGREKR